MEVETAAILSLMYGRFIEVWRQKEKAVQRSRMTRLLLRNSSHEGVYKFWATELGVMLTRVVRTPLNAIINYLEIALEGSIDDGTRKLIEKAHTASRSLVYVIDDLLNLAKAEDGAVTSPTETFDLADTGKHPLSLTNCSY